MILSKIMFMKIWKN